MIRITDVQKAKDRVQVDTLYHLVEPVKVTGKIDFTVFGRVLLNGVEIGAGRHHIHVHRKLELAPASEGAGVLFHQLPPEPVFVPEEYRAVPVPDPQVLVDPEHARFIRWAQEYGLLPEGIGTVAGRDVEFVDEPQEELDQVGGSEDEFEDGFDFPIDYGLEDPSETVSEDFVEDQSPPKGSEIEAQEPAEDVSEGVDTPPESTVPTT